MPATVRQHKSSNYYCENWFKMTKSDGTNSSDTGSRRASRSEDVGLEKEGDKDKMMMRVYHFTEQQLTELKEAFMEFDRTGTGVIPAHDLGNTLRSMGQTPTEADLQDMLQDATLDDTGSLTMDEFLKLVGSRGLQSEREIHQDFEDALRFFDKDGRGLLDADELKSAQQSFGEPLDDEDIAEMMRLADVKGDGRIDYLEFMRKLTLK